MTSQRKAGVLLFWLPSIAFSAAACDEAPAKPLVQAVSEPRQVSLGREPLQTLPDRPTLDLRLVTLGRKLFDERRLSSDDSVACASCHDLKHGGDDGRPRSIGIRGHFGAVNAPSVFNAGLNFVLFWDGRAKTLEEQIDGPVTHPDEMGSTWSDVVSKLGRDPEYQKSFSSAFPDGITAENVRRSIAAYERTLLTHRSPFDRWLGGETAALSPAQKAGYELFKAVGCIACHQGRNVGGNMFQRFGVLGDYFKDRGNVSQADYGRFNVTKLETDRYVFRVPSLRNVEHTAPYFHDGSANTLTQAVQIMAKYQLGRSLSDEQVGSLVEFLKSLSGELPDTVSPAVSGT
jgi:cytochrome c peroxidase